MSKEKKTKKAAAEVEKITVADLSEQLGTDARTLRQFIRGLGLKAPEVKQEGFGPRAKYEWDADSKELKQILKAWDERQQAAGE